MTTPSAHERFSARRGLLLGFGGAFVLIAGVAGWSVLASVSGAVIAAGWVEVENRNRTVEHIDGGTVNEILVRDGDRVAADDILLRFGDGKLRSEEAILSAQHVELAALRNRLEAELRAADTISWDADLAQRGTAEPKVKAVLDGQERLFRARAQARLDQVARLRERIGQALDEITGLRAQSEALEQQSQLIDRELKAQRTLFKKGLSQLPRLLALERTAKSLEGRSGSNTARIAGIRGRISELEIQILQIGSLHMEEAEEKVRDASAQENEVKERLALVRKRLGRMELRAPIAGEVFGLTVFAAGEVVRPGEPILQIVPRDAGLVVTARLNPIDVDQVYPGQPALLRFSAFPARETPEFDGRVVRVSGDAVRDPNSGLSWYEVQLAMDTPGAGAGEADWGRDGDARRLFGHLEVTPGMPVEALIRTGERSVVSYLVKPVTDFFHRSLRED
ncbi:MAG: HlyD family type I secretion periplasmic adaptor subunit [Alphaproteobacteria bacterium]|nr:HlyD family type I secretion periplasmic adaptor subunit [Alphaproteobacteria bacterium]